MHLLTLSVLSANSRVVLVVVAFFFFFFIHFLSSFLFSFLNLCGDFELFFWGVEIVSESTLIETSFARQSVSSLPSRPRVTAPGVRELDFSVPSVQGHRRWGRPRQCLLGALEKKNLSLRPAGSDPRVGDGLV